MAKTTTYQISISYRDPKDSDNDKLVLDVTSVQAQDERHAERIAMTKVPAEYNDKLAHIEVTVRPFIEPARQEKASYQPAASRLSSSSGGSSNGGNYSYSAKTTSFNLVERRSSHASKVSQYDVGISNQTGVATFDVERCASGLSVIPTRETLEKFDYELLKKAAEWVFKQAQY